MSTPEAKVKLAVKKVLDSFGDKIDGFWPVPAGYGESHLDYVGCCNSFFFCIETKAPGKKPTPRQLERIRTVQLAGGFAFIIDGTNKTTTYNELKTWLMLLCEVTHGNLLDRRAGMPPLPLHDDG